MEAEVKAQRTSDNLLKNGTEEEKKAREEYFTNLEKFYEELSFKFDIVDPLDRNFPNPDEEAEDKNQAISVEKLKNELVGLNSISGNKLNAPLSPAIMTKVNKLFTKEDKKCH